MPDERDQSALLLQAISPNQTGAVKSLGSENSGTRAYD